MYVQGTFFVVPAGGGANADDPIASPGLEGVFIDSGWLFFFFLFFHNFCLLSSLFRAKRVVEMLCMGFDTIVAAGSIAARTPCLPPPPSLGPSLSLELGVLAWSCAGNSSFDVVHPVTCNTSVQESRLSLPQLEY